MPRLGSRTSVAHTLPIHIQSQLGVLSNDVPELARLLMYVVALPLHSKSSRKHCSLLSLIARVACWCQSRGQRCLEHGQSAQVHPHRFFPAGVVQGGATANSRAMLGWSTHTRCLVWMSKLAACVAKTLRDIARYGTLIIS